MSKIYQQINEYLRYCEMKNLSERTIQTRRKRLFTFALETNVANVSKITNSLINDWASCLLNRRLKPDSYNEYLKIVILFCKYFREMGANVPLRIPLVPLMKSTDNANRVYFTKKQIDDVCESANEVNRLMIEICFDTGMRLSELANLRISDFDGNCVHYVGKGRKSHTAYIRNQTLEHLGEFLDKYDVRIWLWEESTHLKPLSSNSVASRMKSEFVRCGYNNFHPHALRHSFATHLQGVGASTEEIQHMIGHASVATTERYLHGFDDSRMKELFEKYA